MTVLQDPSGQTCGVTAGSGTVASADVTGVQVNCTTTPTSFTVGGSILGLTGPGLMLIDGETSEMLGVIAGAAQFTFPTGRSPGSLYDVFVYGTAHPVGQWCDVTNGQGTVASSNVTSIAVTCANAHQIGGTVSGLALASQVWVRNDSTNATETLPIVANGAFVMSLPVVAGGSYSFSIDTQPPGQTCLITNGSGTMPAADVATVSIVCTP